MSLGRWRSSQRMLSRWFRYAARSWSSLRISVSIRTFSITAALPDAMAHFGIGEGAAFEILGRAHRALAGHDLLNEAGHGLKRLPHIGVKGRVLCLSFSRVSGARRIPEQRGRIALWCMVSIGDR